MYALVSFFGFGFVNGSSAGQAYTVHGTPSAFAQETTQSNAELCSAGVVRYWLDNARPGRPTQSYAGMAG
jgi:hypothetical protein